MNKIRGPGIKKIWLTLLVVLTMLFSSVLMVSATSGGVDGPGTGGSEGGGHHAVSGTKWDGQVGARFYLVGPNGNRVSKVVDILKVNTNSDLISQFYTTSRTEPLGDIGVENSIMDMYASVSSVMPGMIWPLDSINNKPVGQGEAFKQWFTSTSSNGKSIAYNWLETTVNGGKLFAPSTGIKTDPQTGQQSVVYSMIEDDLALIVEPVIWHHPASYSGKNPDGVQNSGVVIYGSITNLIQWHAQHNWIYAKNDDKGYISGGNVSSLYQQAITGFYVGGQATSNYHFTWPNDIDIPGIKTLPDVLSKIQSNNSGYAIHYYTPQELTDETGQYKHKIFDLEVEIEATKAEYESLTLETLLAESYPVTKTNLPIKYNIPDPPPNGYDMPSQAPNRGYKNPKGEYKFTTLVKTAEPEKTLEKFKDGDTLFNALQGSLSHEQKGQLNNIRTETRNEPTKKFYYINIWVSYKEPEKSPAPPKPPASGSISGSNGYIRKDEITAAQKTTIPGGTVSIVPKATPPSCNWGGTGHGHGASYVSWNSFKGNFTSSAVKEHKVLHSSKEGDPYTVVGTPGSAYRMKYGIGVTTTSLTTQKYNSGTTLVFSMPVNSQVDFIAHRSGGDAGLLTPPLAAYMSASAANVKYKKYMQESSINHQEVYDPTKATGKYGYTEATKAYNIDFRAYGEVTERTTEASYNAKYNCGYWDYDYHEYDCDDPPKDCCPHSYTTRDWVDRSHWINNHTRHTSSVANGGGSQNFKIGVEGTYNGRPITVDPVLKEFKVYKSGPQNLSDGGILAKTPIAHDFYPTYIMRADYDEHAYESARGKDDIGNGNKEPVWMLSKQKRSLYTYNVHTVSLTGLTEPGVQAPWSTDKPDLDNEDATGMPTVKAGLVVKPKQTTAEYTVKSTVWLHDPRFVDPDKRGAVTAKNTAALKEHNDIVHQFLAMGKNQRDAGFYAFGYSSIPGAYDLDMVARGVTALKNNFENVVNGSRRTYSDSQVGDVISQTQLTMTKATSSQSSVAATGFYSNKIEGDNDANISRSFTINVPASGYAQAQNKTITLTAKSSVSGSGEHAQCQEDGLNKIHTLLETGSGTHSWYKEDYEGMVCVTLTTKVTIQLEGGYSVLWRALSDWRDLQPIKPYETAKPDASGIANGIQPVIKQGFAGIGYGIMTDSFRIGSNDFGRVSLLWEPYLFHIRASAYDDVVR